MPDRASAIDGTPPVVTICRCEEVTEAEILAAYEQGYHHVDEIKRKLRIGMGPCGGRTCMPLLLGILSRKSGKPVGEIAPPVARPPLKPMPLAWYAELEAHGRRQSTEEGEPK
jgi:NAD(P)H-nitrite reductase large subunit